MDHKPRKLQSGGWARTKTARQLQLHWVSGMVSSFQDVVSGVSRDKQGNRIYALIFRKYAFLSLNMHAGLPFIVGPSAEQYQAHALFNKN